MFWAVQGMAAEFSTLKSLLFGFSFVPKKLENLVKNLYARRKNEAEFTKKSGRKNYFFLQSRERIRRCFAKAIESGAGQTLTMFSEGKDEKGDLVSKFAFTEF